VRRLRVVSLLLALTTLITVAGCGQLFEKPRVRVRSVNVTSLSFAGVGFDIVFAVENPNVIGVDLAKLDYQLDIDGHRFAQGRGNHPLHVPAQGTGQLTLPVSFKFVDLTQALASLFTKRTVPFSIATRLGFGTPIGVITIPLSHQGTLPVPQLPSISVGAAQVGSVSLSGATLALTLHLRNNNSFALPLGPLDYALKINGTPLVSASTQPTQLAAGGTLPLVISTHLDFLRLGMSVLRAVQSRSATLALDGTFDLKGYAMPVHLQTTLR
jgi:LEA14-like dessication related protein